MMAFSYTPDAENRPNVRQLPAMIELAEQRGDMAHAQMLRGWLAEANAKKQPAPSLRKLAAQERHKITRLPAQEYLTEEDCQNAAPDETIITTSLDCYSRDIRFRLYDREVTDISQLTRWRQRFLPAIGLSANQIKIVNRFQDAIGFPVGSDLDLLTELPPKSPFGIDLRDGRLPADVHDIVRKLMYGEETFRSASVLLGSRGLSKVPPHQRSCSVVQRHARMAANYRRMAIIDQHPGEAWLVSVSLREFHGCKPNWGLALKVLSRDDALARLEAVAEKPVYQGISSRGCPIILEVV